MFDLVTWPRNPWSIFDELESLQADMNRMLTGQQPGERGRRGRAWRRGPTYPLMNIWSSADGLVIDAELPGVDPKDVDISVTGDQLILRGKVNAGEDMEGETYHRRERPAGEFTRTLQLPFRADSGAVKANYKNGVLRLTVPRSEDEKPKKIAIEAS
jgi:HSP20 family protein